MATKKRKSKTAPKLLPPIDADERMQLIDRIERRLYDRDGRVTTLRSYDCAEDVSSAATDIYNVIHRLAHSTIPGDQRRTLKSRMLISAEIRANIKEAMKVL